MASSFEKSAKNKVIADSLFKTLSEHPEKSEELYQGVKKLYLTYVKGFQLGQGAEGNLQQYTDDIKSASSDYKEAKNALEVLK